MSSDQFVLDTPRVRAFVDGVRSLIAASDSPTDACERIRPSFAELLADPEWLPDEYRRDAPDSGMGGGIGQWLLFRAGDGSLSLFSLVVPSGSETPVHDHLAWGLVGLYQGTQDEEVYEHGADGLAPRRVAGAHTRGLLRADPSGRRHPPGPHHVGRDVRVHSPADERHRLCLAPPLRAGDRRDGAVQIRVRQRPVRGAGRRRNVAWRDV